MPLPESTSLTLQQSLRLIAKRVRKSIHRVRESLVTAAIEGTITATGCRHASALPGEPEYFAAPMNRRTDVSPEAWGSEICWQISRVGLYSLVRFDRAEIERWLATAAEHVERKAVPAVIISLSESPTADATAAGEGALLKARGGSKPRAFWAEARRAAMEWLEEEGCPAPGDGQQAILERHIAQWLEDRGHRASEPTVRRHVRNWISERRAELSA
jgi:hypothetical protein